VSTGCASGAWLVTQGHQLLIAQRSAIGALVNILLNMLLIPRMGLIGAAVSTSISYLCSVYLIGILRKDVFPNLLASIFPFRFVSFKFRLLPPFVSRFKAHLSRELPGKGSTGLN